MKQYLYIILLVASTVIHAQKVSITLNWGEKINIIDDIYSIELENGFINDFIPFYQNQIQGANGYEIKLKEYKYYGTELTPEEKVIFKQQISNIKAFSFNSYNSIENGKSIFIYEASAIYKENDKLYKLSLLEVNYSDVPKNGISENTFNFKSSNTSALSTGSIYKFQISNTGIHKITYEELINNNVISDRIELNQIKVYGNDGTPFGFHNSEIRPSDLNEIPFKSNSIDNYLDPNEYIYFFAEKSGKWEFNKTDTVFNFNKDYYEENNYIFLKIGEQNSKTVLSIDNNSKPQSKDGLFGTKVHYHEKNEMNYIHSGRDWVGESYSNNNKLQFSLKTSKKIKSPFYFSFRNAIRSVRSGSLSHYTNVKSVFNNDTILTSSIISCSPTYYENFAIFKSDDTKNHFLSEKQDINLEYVFFNKNSNDEAWLDYFEINYNERLNFNGDQCLFYNAFDLKSGVVRFNVLSSLDSYKIWNVTNYSSPVELATLKTDTGFVFQDETDSIVRYIIFDPNKLYTASFKEKISTQNLHGKPSVNYIVITSREIKDAAEKFVQLHSDKDGLTGRVEFVSDIYNEFGSGRRSAPAIRDYIKYMYEKGTNSNDSLKYVLLLGEGSYDLKNYHEGNFEIIPTYQSKNSASLINSYVTDDFYGLLDPNEGEYENGDLLDIGVGRIPVLNNKEAESVFSKIENYYGINESKLIYNNPSSPFGIWKNKVVFAADDEDQNTHMVQAEDLAQKLAISIPTFQISKVFLDAFTEIQKPSSEENEEANLALNKHFNSGSFIVNYTGHGGERGWAEEGLLRITDINNFSNKKRCPLLVTATCEFSRHDLPELRSAGERILLRENGGALSLFTTVRLVFSGPNKQLNLAFYNVLKNRIQNPNIKLGDLFKETKNSYPVSNSRNFTLLGDPAISLNFSKRDLIIDSIQVKSVKTNSIKGLQSGILYGSVKDFNNQFDNSYSGEGEIEWIDKEYSIQCLNNNNMNFTFTYKTQDKSVFKSVFKIENGKFEVPFQLPINIDPQKGFSKINLYGISSNHMPASGNSNSYEIGGIDSTLLKDDQGPIIEIYLNDSSFTFGDLVENKPKLVAVLSDENGINTSQNNFGKELHYILNEETSKKTLLSDYYQTELNNFKKGTIQYDMGKLENGRYAMKLSASDNLNNSGQGYTEFIIDDKPELALNHILNYPNPFTTNTGFYFEHNQWSGPLNVKIQIVTISGKIIKTIETTVDASSKRIGPIKWDGLDEFGDRIGKGVYLYKIEVSNDENDKESSIEKLVILR